MRGGGSSERIRIYILVAFENLFRRNNPHKSGSPPLPSLPKAPFERRSVPGGEGREYREAVCRATSGGVELS